MAEIKPMYIYQAVVKNVVDGDTVDLIVSLGFYMTASLRFRLSRINTAEMHDPRPVVQNMAGKAKARLIELLADPHVTIRSSKPYAEDKYGRWLADVYLSDGRCVNDVLLEEKLAKVYPDKF